MLVEILENNIDQRLIKQVVDALKKGELIIYPTDTVYAIGCDLMNKSALEKLARLKNLKLEKSKFAIICHDISEVSEYVKQLDRSTFKMLNKSLPGPFTFILEANGEVPKFFNNKRKEIGVKIPDNKIVLEIVKSLGNPLVTTSLIDNEDELLEYFVDPYEIYQRFDDKVHTIIDGGTGKLEASTIVKCTGDEIEVLRQGAGQLDV
jgi:tRNA threonylcarbamoyl adenosine modification protein (Sua5/YciO/YrdC/YwlC family)